MDIKKILSIFIFVSVLYSFLYSCSSDEETTSSSVADISVPEVKKYTLSVTSEDGGTISSDGGTYEEGTEITISVTANEGYEFIGWDGIESNEPSLTITLNSNLNIKALFKILTLTSIELLNPQDSIVVTEVYNPILRANYENGTFKEISQTVEISSQNNKVSIKENNSIVGGVKGDEIITFKYEDQNVSQEIYVNNIEFEEIEEKFRSSNNSQIEVPVIIINIYHTNDGIIHNDTIGPSDYFNIINPPLIDLKSRIKNTLYATKKAIELGTSFRDYGKNEVSSYISIDTKAYINVYTNEENSYLTKSHYYLSKRTYDYHTLFNDLNLEGIIRNELVKEIWITEFAYGEFPSLVDNNLYDNSKDSTIPETNMSSPFTGDISNSYKIPDDLPIYDNTYVVYGNSGARSLDTNIHNRGHQIENQLSFIEKNKINGEELFWNKFVGVNYDKYGLDYYSAVPNGRCGNTHFPPNGDDDYDYCNSISIESDLFNWTPQGGDKTIINCETWSNINYNTPDVNYYNLNKIEVKWLITWFQSIPGYNNNISYLRDGNNYNLTNWWDLFYNWDNAIKEGKTLWE